MSESKKTSWRKVAAVIGFLALVIPAGTQVYDWVGRFGRELKGTGMVAEFTIPPRVLRFVDSLRKNLRPENVALFEDIRYAIRNDFTLDLRYWRDRGTLDTLLFGEDPFAYSMRLAMGRAIERQMPGQLLAHARDLRTFLDLTVENRGSKALSGVMVTVPGARLATITRDDGSVTDTVVSGPVSLGGLRPKEQAKLKVWSEDWLDSRWAIGLTHDNGIGKVSLQKPTGTIGQFADRALRSVVSMVILALPLFAAFVLLGSRQTRQDGLPASGVAKNELTGGPSDHASSETAASEVEQAGGSNGGSATSHPPA